MGYGYQGKSGEEPMAGAVATHKRCRTCREAKPLTDFLPRKDGKGGRRTICLECRLKYYHPQRKARRPEHPHAEWLRKELGRGEDKSHALR